MSPFGHNGGSWQLNPGCSLELDPVSSPSGILQKAALLFASFRVVYARSGGFFNWKSHSISSQNKGWFGGFNSCFEVAEIRWGSDKKLHYAKGLHKRASSIYTQGFKSRIFGR